MKATYRVFASLVGAGLLIALVAASFWAFNQIGKAGEARKYTYSLIIRANALLSELTDAETGQRGYSLTGDEAFLEPYLAVRDSISGNLEALHELTLDSAARKHLDALAPLVADKLAQMAHVIESRRHHDMTAALAEVGGGQGKHLMDSVRSEMRNFVQIQEAALAQHDVEFQSNMRHLFALIVTSSLFMLLVVLLFAYVFYLETQQRIKRLFNLETQHLLDIQEETNKQLLQANVTLQVSEEKLAVTLNSIGDAVIATDAEARVTLLNPLAEQLTGWTQVDAIGRPVDEIFNIINKETRQPATIPVMETLAHGTIQGLANHTVLIARDGNECDIADSCAPIRDRDGRVIGAVLVFRDVTKEYAVQQALSDSAALIQTVLNTVVDGIITLHARGGIIETVNPAAEQMFGYTAAELIGQNFSLLIPELDRDQRNGSLEYYSASDEARAIGLGREVVGQRKDGSIFPMEIAVSEMRLGGQRYFTGILRDNTARKLAEEALLKAGALQNAIFNSANFSSIATDAKGVIQIFNVGAERMLGYAAADVLNKITPADISDPQEVISRAKALSDELSTSISPGFEALAFKASRGIEDIYELTYIRKDGSRFPAVVSVTALRDAQKAIIGYLLIGTDNTTRKQIEAEQTLLDQRLRDQQFYTRSLIESNIDAIMTTDPSGIITDVNKQMMTLTGCQRDELIGAAFKDYFTDPERAEASIKLVLSEKKVTNYELTVRARDGKETVVSYNATTFYDRDRTLQGVFASARDITERNRLDQVLKEKNAELESAKSLAEKANLAKSDFLSSMSHELRTPLNAILGFAQLLEVGNPPPTAAQILRLQQIIKAGWYLLDLINEILDLAVIESGKLSLSREAVSLIEVIQECQAMVEPQAQQRGITLSFLPFDHHWFANADRTRVKQVLINLLTNAIKYNREHGTVEVQCTESNPERLRISVKDSGAGLSPEKLLQLFQPFNRLGQETGAEEGTGIGLVVTKQLIELMGGAIGVKSTVDVGSEFWIDLIKDVTPQLAAGHTPAAELAPQSQGNPAVRTLLYVEDNPANLMLVEQIIEAHPHIRMLSARDGYLGIAMARTHLPDVILMDINLPGISGIQALKILRQDPAIAHIPVIALSANAMFRDIEKGLAAGFFRYLTKPIKINEFISALDDALEFSETKLPHANETGPLQ
ncbi:MAG: PAS domain S-box protein [Methylobacter sp.]|uniref:PAS domain S-box protein n=1 Tax=Methylobacter sp. TaxID=2051955 RepID=UPI0025E9EE3E|nr:PAS domain S-box protein [Methylobacter sp.]MCK9619107.1 PAS domain S-box protein [Methylobacter sp.]